MKTTSFEISKKLAEIGFKAETAKEWVKFFNLDGKAFQLAIFEKDEDDKVNEKYLAYDLETILEALPPFFDLEEGERYLLTVRRNGLIDFVGYCRFNGNHHSSDYAIQSEPGESLADTAARLLIILAEKGIINFNKSDEVKNV